MAPRFQQRGTLLLCQIVTLLALAHQATSATCYNPDGSLAPATDIPCETTGGDTACCSSGAFCMTNGYCLNNMVVVRGSCTDITWTNPNCALQCKKGRPNPLWIPWLRLTFDVQVKINSGKGLAPCSSNLWACDYNTCSQGNFTLPVGNIILHNYQAASLGISSQVTVNANAPLTTGSLTATTTSGQAATTSATPTPAATCISPADQQMAIASVNSDHEKKLAAVGAGVGVPLGIAVVAFLALFGLERRRNTQSSVERKNPLGQNMDQQGLGGWSGNQTVPRQWNTRYEAPNDPSVELTGTETMTHEMQQFTR